MTVWLTPERKPFFGGSYFPDRDGDSGDGTGFLTLLKRLRAAYDEQPGQVAGAALQITQGIQQALTSDASADSLPDPAVLDAAFRSYEAEFDSVNGGVNHAPRFPSEMPIRFLLRYYHRTGNPHALAMARLTLTKMAAGGMYDQIGGGFHRYSTDGKWLVPHFEKMLYDNAQLTMDYLEGWQVTHDSSYARVVREILRYIQRDMTSPQGAFYSASDADSPAPGGKREEGRFFTWTLSEMESVLGNARARIVEKYWGVLPDGVLRGRSVLSVPQSDEAVARALGVSVPSLRRTIESAREQLFAARARRPPPLRDEKILASWNGLMISAHARAALVLGEPEYARRAERAADFVLTRMRHEGELYRSFADGRAHLRGYLDDYAFLIAGLLDLYEATGHSRWLREAKALDNVVARRFEDAKEGGHFLTGAETGELLAREKSARDEAEPSGNSVEALNLLRLAEFTSDDRYRVRGDRTLKAFARSVRRSPTAFAEMLLALDFRLDSPQEVVIVASGGRPQVEPFLAKLRSIYLPNRIVVVTVDGADLAQQATLVPLLEGKSAQGGLPTAYVCERGACKLPTRDPGIFAQQLARMPSRR